MRCVGDGGSSGRGRWTGLERLYLGNSGLIFPPEDEGRIMKCTSVCEEGYAP